MNATLFSKTNKHTTLGAIEREEDDVKKEEEGGERRKARVL